MQPVQKNCTDHVPSRNSEVHRGRQILVAYLSIGLLKLFKIKITGESGREKGKHHLKQLVGFRKFIIFGNFKI